MRTHSDESGESGDDSTADGWKSVTLSTKLGKEPDLVQQTCIGQQENKPVTISRHVESDNDGCFSHHEPTIRDPPHGRESQHRTGAESAGVRDGETSVNQ